jgi:hypothetical protein
LNTGLKPVETRERPFITREVVLVFIYVIHAQEFCSDPGLYLLVCDRYDNITNVTTNFEVHIKNKTTDSALQSMMDFCFLMNLYFFILLARIKFFKNI